MTATEPAASSATDTAGPRRGSRADQRAATRRRLLDAAIESLSELGYARTTTLEVQARAGVSRGALLHHFASRNELVVAAISHLGALRFAELHDEALRLPKDVVGFETAVDVLVRLVFAPSTLAALELWMASRTDPGLAESMRAHEQTALAQLTSLFELLVGPEIAADPRCPGIRDTLVYSLAGAAIGAHLRSDRWLPAQIEAWKQLGHGLGDTAATP